MRTAVASNSVAWQNVTTPSTYKKFSVVFFFKYFLFISIHCQFLQIKNGVKIFFRTNSLHFLLRLIIKDGITIPIIMKIYIASRKKGISNSKRSKCCNIFALTFPINLGTMYKRGYQTFCITIISSS